MTTGLLILVSAPSGAGKTSLVSAALEADPKLVVSISHTTRRQRPREKDGVNYHFVSPAEFDDMIRAGEFLEHAKVFDHQYGTAKSQVDDLRARGLDVILEIDWQGADQVRALEPSAISVFILPPSAAVLQQRLQQRAQDSADTIERRLAEAQLEIDQAPRFDYLIVNDDFDTALDELLTIFKAQRLTSAHQIDNHPQAAAILSGS